MALAVTELAIDEEWQVLMLSYLYDIVYLFILGRMLLKNAFYLVLSA